VVADRTARHRGRMELTGMNVVVAGAGIGGMAAAVLLARAGASVTLVERSNAGHAVGAGILLQPNGIAVLDGLGVAEALRRRGCRLDRALLRDVSGAVLAPLTAPAYAPGLDHMLAVRRAELHTVLLDAVAAEPGVRLRLGTTVTGCEPDATVVTADGERLGADLAVGADGVHSAVRTSGGFPARARPTGHVYLRGLVPRNAIAAEPGETWAPAGIFGGAPVDADTWYFYASATAPGVAEAVAARDLAALRRLWERVHPAAVPLLERVRSFDDLLVNDVVRVDCARWYDGRRVLVGDAAHAMAPTAGQGANSALVDGAVLVGRLATASTVEEALADYDRLRRPAVTRVQDRADLLSRLAHQRNPAVRWLRDVALRAAGGRRAGDRVAREAQQVDPVALRELVRRLDRSGT